ncbi:MAG: glycosyltransferase family 2 protein [Candidatus Omnitrophota bacterium]
MNKEKVQYSLTVVSPALNEEENVSAALEGMVAALNDAGIDWEIILVDDGSIDKTGALAEDCALREPRIKVIHHERPMGIGYSFRDGACAAAKDAVTYLPGDGENDPAEVIKYVGLLAHVDVVVPFVINKEVRSRTRQFLSKLYLAITNTSFGTNFNYTNGNVIYKRSILGALAVRSNSFFFQTEYLLRSTAAGFTFAEVPIRIRARLQGRSKALSFKSFRTLVVEFTRLFLELRIVVPLKSLFS